jgi:hypothetical protein
LIVALGTLRQSAELATTFRPVADVVDLIADEKRAPARVPRFHTAITSRCTCVEPLTAIAIAAR